jgi:hypothetical protein
MHQYCKRDAGEKPGEFTVPEITYYEYDTTAGSVSGTYSTKSSGEITSGLIAGQELSSGEEFIFDGKIYTYDGGADYGAVGGPEVGFFATTANGKVHLFSFSALPGPETLYLNTSQGYNVPDAACFVRGSSIRTSNGDVAVEALRAGDMVATWQNGETVFRPITWMGGRKVNLAAHPQPETVQPIRIQRGAFADNTPQRDLLVSPDHGIFVDGKLVCARQLVNGTTITRENGLAAVEYFHVELDQHAILYSEGLLSESYLDTGNRGLFTNSGKPIVLHPNLTTQADHPTREAASCVPFVWDEANVQPVWEALAERAATLGQPVPTVDTTIDPKVSIVADGRSLQPVYAANGRYHFLLPQGVREVRLVSLTASPTDTRPWLEDRRRLGVYVARIVVRSAQEVQDIPVDHPALSKGWWSVEHNGTELRRWTDGDAVLSLPVTDAATMLEIHATNSGLTYLAQDDARRLAA